MYARCEGRSSPGQFCSLYIYISAASYSYSYSYSSVCGVLFSVPDPLNVVMCEPTLEPGRHHHDTALYSLMLGILSLALDNTLRFCFLVTVNLSGVWA